MESTYRSYSQVLMERSEMIWRREAEKIGEKRGEKIGEKRGKLESSIEIAKKLIGKMDVEEISLVTGLPLEQVQQLEADS